MVADMEASHPDQHYLVQSDIQSQMFGREIVTMGPKPFNLPCRHVNYISISSCFMMKLLYSHHIIKKYGYVRRWRSKSTGNKTVEGSARCFYRTPFNSVRLRNHREQAVHETIAVKNVCTLAPVPNSAWPA